MSYLDRQTCFLIVTVYYKSFFPGVLGDGGFNLSVGSTNMWDLNKFGLKYALFSEHQFILGTAVIIGKIENAPGKAKIVCNFAWR